MISASPPFSIRTPAGSQVVPPYCTDPPGVDRATVHTQVSDLAIQFFARTFHIR